MYQFQLNQNGCIRFGDSVRICIQDEPIGILVHHQTAYRPQSASIYGSEADIQYPCGVCRIKITESDGYVKLTLISVPDGTDGFVFGPYETNAAYAGEILGAGWYEDGSVVCIQSLMPKVVEGASVPFTENKSGITLDGRNRPAVICGNGVSLQMSSIDMSREIHRPDGFVIKPVPDSDASMIGAAVALLYEENADALLTQIGEMEPAEGLPHPLYSGNYAKRDPHASATYIVFGGTDLTHDEMVELACRAEVSCVYFSNVFDHWGHFTIRRDLFPNGVSDVRRYADQVNEGGVILGAHSLTNFLTPNDEYITPIPHSHLQVRDTTRLTADISADDTEIFIADAGHYGEKSTMNTFRIGDELIVFDAFDADHLRLIDCQRGAFGTAAAAHTAGDIVQRLNDHGYGTFFPDIELQDEVADNLGRTVRDCGIRKLSFDGLEGCDCTGYPEYARNRFVKRVCDIVGSDFLCEGSNISNYQWHAFSYCNWGEPWYDSIRRGGMYTYRYMNTLYMKRNLLPPMLGWYIIALNSGRFEATSPEMMEYMMSRSTAFGAGSAFSIGTEIAKNHGKIGEYMDMIRIWNRFSLMADIPKDVLERMQEEKTDWHLEETEDGWMLTELVLREQDLGYGDRVIGTEAGHVGDEVQMMGKKIRHSSTCVVDAPYPGFHPEPLHIRIRVGEPGHGSLSDLELYGAIRFSVTAKGGDYLEYTGGVELYHYDCNYNLLEVITGIGHPLTFDGRHGFGWGAVRYTTDDDPTARYMLTEIRCRRKHHILPKYIADKNS